MTEKAHPSPLLEPVDPGGGGQGEGGRRAAQAEPRPGDAAARRGQEQQREGEHAAGDGHAAGQDQQDVRHVGQVQGETSLSGVDLESMQFVEDILVTLLLLLFPKKTYFSTHMSFCYYYSATCSNLHNLIQTIFHTSFHKKIYIMQLDLS